MAARQPQKVLIAVDDSEYSEQAFEYYINNLHRIDSKVVVLHSPEVSNVTMRMMRDEQAPYKNWDGIWKEEEHKWNSLKTKYEQKLQEAKVLNGHFQVDQSNNPGESIVHRAKKDDIDFLVIGCRGFGSVRRKLVGSISEYVLHHAHCPVCVCKI